MSSVSLDRLSAAATSVAVKAPCLVATTASITLSGLQTIDGVALAAGDRVLVKNQATASQNGIYIADTSQWQRAPDGDGFGDFVNGTLVWIASGSTNGSSFYQLSASEPVVVGTTTMSFSQSFAGGDASALTFTPAGTGAVSRSIQAKLRDVAISVRDFGAAGDGTTDDTAAITAAFAAASSGDVVRFEPGDTYIISSPFTVSDKNLVVIAHGATIKMAAESYQHAIIFQQTTGQGEYLHWYGGTLDGNKANQYYWPSSLGDYANSNINGAAFDQATLDATRQGNTGIITSNQFKHVIFDGIIVKDIVGNGIVARWADQVAFTNCKGTGGLPVTYFEMQAAGQSPVENAYFKVQSFNVDQTPQGDQQSRGILMSGCETDGGCMGAFVRTNVPKPEQTPGRLTVVGCAFRNAARAALWTEAVTDLYIYGGEFTGEYKPSHAYRGDGGRIVVGNGTRHCVISGARVQNGRIDGNNGNEMDLGLVTGCDVRYTLATSGVSYAISSMTHVQGTRVESTDQGIQLLTGGKISDSYVECDHGNAAVAATITGSTIGRKIQTITTFTSSAATDGQTAFDTGDSNLYAVDRVYRTISGYEGGTPLLVRDTDYSVTGSTVTFTLGANAGDIITVEYVASVTETFSATAAQTLFTMTAAGSEIISVKVDAVASTAVQSSPTGSQYVPGKTSSNYITVTTPAMTGGESVVIKYLPPIKQTAGNVRPIGASLTMTGSRLLGIGTVDLTGGSMTGPHQITGCLFADTVASAISLSSGVVDIAVSDCHFERCYLNAIRCAVAGPRVRVQNTVFRNCGTDASQANAEARMPLGANSSSGMTVTELFVDGCDFINEKWPGAYTVASKVSSSTTYARRRNNSYKNMTLGTWSATKVDQAGNNVDRKAVGAVGTANTGTTAAEEGDGPHHKTTLTVSTTLPAIAGGADLAVGKLLYTLPAGAHVVRSARMSLAITQTQGNITADTPDGGLGTTIASGVVAVLGGTAAFENILTGQTFNDCNGTAEVKTVADQVLVIESGDAHTIYFNVADGWAASGDSAALLTGTVVLDWVSHA